MREKRTETKRERKLDREKRRELDWKTDRKEEGGGELDRKG